MTQIICIIWWFYNKNLNFLGNFHNGHYQKWKGQITVKIFSRNIGSRFLAKNQKNRKSKNKAIKMYRVFTHDVMSAMLVSQDSKTAAMLVLTCFLILTPYSWPRDWKLPITEKPKLRTLQRPFHGNEADGPCSAGRTILFCLKTAELPAHV